MKKPEKSIELIFNSSISFDERCAEVFRFQAGNNPVYKRFADVFGIHPTDNVRPADIPLLPIRAFRDTTLFVTSDKKGPELVFRSSGTSGMSQSTHYILSKKMYEEAIVSEFKRHFPFGEFTLACFMPGYGENPQSSLIWMAKHLIKSDPSGLSCFVSGDDLLNPGWTEKQNNQPQKTLLFGAAFGLMDIIESGKVHSLKNLEILETGGMKTHRREISKADLRQALSSGFDVPLPNIHSEYGMCELLSQMYAIGGEWFQPPHWVHISIRDPKDPARICNAGEQGKIGIIDLANMYSCPFILTDDRGVMDRSGRLQVLGRWDTEDMRGCNFLIDHE